MVAEIARGVKVNRGRLQIDTAAGGAYEAGEHGVDIGVVLVDATEGGDHAVARIAGLIAEGLCELGVDAADATVELDEHVATVAFDSNLCQMIRTITWNYKISPDSDPKPLIIQLGGAQICSKKGQK